MPGLDQAAIDELDTETALCRLRADVLSDFILAPHYAAVFEHAGEDLWDRVSTKLRAGTFEPSLPILEEVPKETGVTRPGAILSPFDRILYQALVDHSIPVAEAQLDRQRVYSHVPAAADVDAAGAMFQDGHGSWQRLQDEIRFLCGADQYEVAIRADVSAFYEHINQHNLINLLHSSGCDSRGVNLLERLLLAWTQRESHGILQGMAPSDFLGTFSLCPFDAEMEVMGIPSVRYVDDIYMFFPDDAHARRGLISLVRSLRHEGLHVNERKTAILDADTLLFEETELDRMFNEARDEVDEWSWTSAIYGFSSAWRAEADSDEGAEDEEPEPGALEAVEALYNRVDEPNVPVNRIERFCLPILGAAGSPLAIDRAVEGIQARPHLAQVYAS